MVSWDANNYDTQLSFLDELFKELNEKRNLLQTVTTADPADLSTTRPDGHIMYRLEGDNLKQCYVSYNGKYHPIVQPSSYKVIEYQFYDVDTPTDLVVDFSNEAVDEFTSIIIAARVRNHSTNNNFRVYSPDINTAVYSYNYFRLYNSTVAYTASYNQSRFIVPDVAISTDSPLSYTTFVMEIFNAFSTNHTLSMVFQGMLTSFTGDYINASEYRYIHGTGFAQSTLAITSLQMGFLTNLGFGANSEIGVYLRP